MFFFLFFSQVIVGASNIQSNDRDRETYNLDTTDIDDNSSVIEIQEAVNIFTDHYRGCLGELRIGGVLATYYTASELINNTASIRFDIESRKSITLECIVCFEHECENEGSCENPEEIFECTCPTGFEDPLCSTNIDECQFNKCANGNCKDGIGNYTCDCQPAWTGWLCDEDYDECESSPCVHGGICTQTVEPGNYTCECTSQYKGHNCEQLKNRTCTDNPCKYGSCVNRTSKEFE